MPRASRAISAAGQRSRRSLCEPAVQACSLRPPIQMRGQQRSAAGALMIIQVQTPRVEQSTLQWRSTPAIPIAEPCWLCFHSSFLNAAKAMDKEGSDIEPACCTHEQAMHTKSQSCKATLIPRTARRPPQVPSVKDQGTPIQHPERLARGLQKAVPEGGMKLVWSREDGFGAHGGFSTWCSSMPPREGTSALALTPVRTLLSPAVAHHHVEPRRPVRLPQLQQARGQRPARSCPGWSRHPLPGRSCWWTRQRGLSPGSSSHWQTPLASWS